MSRSDYYRPAQHQITNIYRCSSCRHEGEYLSDQFIGDKCPSCGSDCFRLSGESYQADPDDWQEQRDPDGEWRERRY